LLFVGRGTHKFTKKDVHDDGGGGDDDHVNVNTFDVLLMLMI
jgi:hypothetical protein